MLVSMVSYNCKLFETDMITNAYCLLSTWSQQVSKAPFPLALDDLVGDEHEDEADADHGDAGDEEDDEDDHHVQIAGVQLQAARLSEGAEVEGGSTVQPHPGTRA